MPAIGPLPRAPARATRRGRQEMSARTPIRAPFLSTQRVLPTPAIRPLPRAPAQARLPPGLVLQRATAAAAYASQPPKRARATASRLIARTARSCAATRVMRPGSRATASTAPPTAASMSAIASRCRCAPQTLQARATRGNPRACRAAHSRAPRSAAVKRRARSWATRVRNGSASEQSKRSEDRSGVGHDEAAAETARLLRTADERKKANDPVA
jgi:hypothetical protein